MAPPVPAAPKAVYAPPRLVVIPARSTANATNGYGSDGVYDILS